MAEIRIQRVAAPSHISTISTVEGSVSRTSPSIFASNSCLIRRGYWLLFVFACSGRPLVHGIEVSGLRALPLGLLRQDWIQPLRFHAD
ncbi:MULTISPECIES: hypothetical protein [unclassified Yoonia]|uniref:hypothetical protein n=1 Tax=unclassified Yoonia TaxID=2629118 RepID=UPI002AFE1386|nr:MULTISPECIES: hypothetical protein [unclassified Yoonia]